ncbi:MAG: SBBP repeat-containing protein [Acidobacteriaceae bacterium]
MKTKLVQRVVSDGEKPTRLQPLNRAGNPAIPVLFTQNRGQAPADSLFVAQTDNLQVLLNRDGMTLRIADPIPGLGASGGTMDAAASALAGPLQSKAEAMRFAIKEQHLRFLGANPDVTLEPLDEQAGTVNYFLGKDPSRWIHHLNTYARVKYHNLYPGIDVVFYSHNGRLEYDFVVAAGADPREIRFQMDGGDSEQITDGGALRMGSGSEAILHMPLLYQDVANGKKMIGGKFVLHADNTIGFQFASYDRTKPFIIDPTVSLLYSTYVGGVHDDEAQGIALDKAGNSYIVGFSASQNFPVSANAYQTTRKDIGTYVRNVVVAKFSPSGALLYSTFIGGSVNDYGFSIALDSSNDAFVTGYTNSPDYPTTANSIQSALSSGGKTAFLSEVSPDGTTLKYSTYYGPTASGGISRGYQVISDNNNNIYLGGYSGPGLPTTTGVYKPTLASSGGNNGFVAVFNFTQSSASPLMAATYFGTDTPQSNDVFTGNKIVGIALDANGNVWFTGQGYTANLPTTANALQPTVSALSPGCNSGAVPLNSAADYGELSPNLQNLMYSSYLSGQTEAASEAACSEFGWGLSFDSSGNLYVLGVTASDKFPVTTGALLTTFPGSGSGAWVTFLMKLGSNGTKPLWGTYLGGSPGQTFPAKVVVDAAGNPWVAGSTQASNFPMVGTPYQPTLAGQQNGFIIELNPNGSQAEYSTYLGGNATDSLTSFALDAEDNIYAVGATNSSDFPVTADAFQSTLAEGKLDGSNWFFSELGSGSISVVGLATFGNSGDGTLTVDGSGMEQGATCELVQGSTVIDASSTYVNSAGTSMSCSFDLSGAATGSYNIVVTNPNGGSTLNAANAVTVQSGGQPNLSVELVGRSAMRIGVPTTFYINVTNSGTQDAYIVPLWVSLPQGIPFTINGFTQAYSESLASTVGNTSYVSLFVPAVAPGQTSTVTLQVTAPAASSGVPLVATLQPPWFGSYSDFQQAVNGALTTYTPGCVTSTSNAYYLNCLGTYIAYSQTTQNPFTPQVTESPGQTLGMRAIGVRPHDGGGCSSTPTPQGFGEGFATGKAAGITGEPPAGSSNPYTIGFRLGQLSALGEFITGPLNTAAAGAKIQSSDLTQLLRAVSLGNAGGQEHAVGPEDGSSACSPPPTPPILPPASPLNPQPVGSIDPNDKGGPTGDGSTSHYVRAIPLTYNVAFENQPTATAPAAQVVVTDQLDPTKVDLTTVQLTAFTFGTNILSVPPGAKNYNTLFSINSSLSVRIQGSVSAQTGLLTWTFTSIDPSTGLPPTDPSVGFLPPDTDGVSGQGSVIFSVSPKAGDTTGTVISNMATVVFDANAPLSTQTWTNTLDVTPPSSSVQALPATTTSGSFTVNWSGTDTGSGIAFYDIYVSVNGGSYSIWQSQTTATSATYTASTAGSYSFYSIATDKAGNVEAPKSQADAVTQVVLNPGFTLTASGASLSLMPGQSGTIALSVTPVNGFNSAVSFACSGLPAGALCSFSPATVTPNGTAAANTTMTITTTAPTTSKDLAPWPFAGGGAVLALGLFFFRRRRSLPALLCLALLLGVGGMAVGCSGGSGGSQSSGNPGTPAGTSQVTVTASSGAGANVISESVTVPLTVQ